MFPASARKSIAFFMLAWPTLQPGLKTASFVWIEQKSYKIGIKRLK
jgi:hypothetical protein